MDLRSHFAFWPIKNGLLASYPCLQEDVSCEIAVVGGGITGSLIAYQLCEAGVHTVLVEKRDIGAGSTSASTGLLQYEVDLLLCQLIQKVGEKNAVRSYQLCREAIEKIKLLTRKLNDHCDFEEKRSLYLASTKEDVSVLRQEFELRRRHKFKLQFVEQPEIESRFSFSRPGALYSEEGAQIDPHRLTHGLLKAAVKNGLRVFDRTKILSFIPEKKGTILTTDRGYRIRARRTVLSAGYESKGYLSQPTGRLKSTYALISEPVNAFPGWHDQCLIWESARPYLYLRTTSDHRIIVGGEDENFSNPTKRDELIQQKTSILARKFQKLFPDIKLEVAYSWAGTFGETKDGLAYIGANSELPKTYFAMGYGGNGITYSVIAADIIRDDYLGKANPDAKIFRLNR